MSDLKIEKQRAVEKAATPAAGSPFDVFEPMFPVSRFFGVNPFAAMREFSEQMDRLFRTGASSAAKWTPAIDVQRCNGDMVVTAELPGLKNDEVKVEIADNMLIIQGERKREHEDDHDGYHRYERSYGKFYRSIPLPEGAKTDEAKAELTEGVLKISVPAPETRSSRQIPVEQATGAKAAA